ncbi:MAG: 30S ribosomal protein S8e [Promethearchaeota archaeon]
MVQIHSRSRRRSTGAIVNKAKGKRKNELGRHPIETELGNEKKKIIRTKGGGQKIKLFSADKINVVNPKTGEIKNVPIENVEINHSSIDYSRRGIITKGAILETKLGYVRVTSRPGQHGSLNGILTDYSPKKKKK